MRFVRVIAVWKIGRKEGKKWRPFTTASLKRIKIQTTNSKHAHKKCIFKCKYPVGKFCVPTKLSYWFKLGKFDIFEFMLCGFVLPNNKDFEN